MRLGFSIAAHLDPDILMVDEALSVGDSSFQQKCLGRIDKIVRSGTTLLFVTPIVGIITFVYHGRVLDFGIFEIDFNY